MSLQGLWSRADILQWNKSGPAAQEAHTDTCPDLPIPESGIIPQQK